MACLKSLAAPIAARHFRSRMMRSVNRSAVRFASSCSPSALHRWSGQHLALSAERVAQIEWDFRAPHSARRRFRWLFLRLRRRRRHVPAAGPSYYRAPVHARIAVICYPGKERIWKRKGPPISVPIQPAASRIPRRNAFASAVLLHCRLHPEHCFTAGTGLKGCWRSADSPRFILRATPSKAIGLSRSKI